MQATEIQTEFPGGAAEMNRFLDQNIKHPNDAVKANVSGKVTLQFVVEKDGSIEHVKVLKGLGYGCDEEAIRLIKAMPKWSPAMQDGKPVRVYFTMPIKFNLSN